MSKLLLLLFSCLFTIQVFGQGESKSSIREIKRGGGKAEFEFTTHNKKYLIYFIDMSKGKEDSLKVYLLKKKAMLVFRSTIMTLDTLELEPKDGPASPYVLIKTGGNRLLVHKLVFGRKVKLIQNINIK